MVCFSFAKKVHGKCRHTGIKVGFVGHQRLCSRSLNQFTKMVTGIGFRQAQLISPHRYSSIIFPIVQTVNLCTTKSHHIHQSMGSSLQETQIGTVYDTGPVSQDKGSTIFYVFTNLLFKSFPEHIKHRRCYYFITIQILLHIDHIHIQSLFAECVIGFFHSFLIEQSFISWSLGVFHCPAVLPVIYHSHLCRVLRSGNFLKFFQTFSYFRYFLEYSGIILAIMIDHCTMELFRGTLALSKLKIQNTVGSVGNSLHGSCMKHSRFL